MKSKNLKKGNKMLDKLKDNLASIAALIAAVVAIGGGFVKYGEITTKLSQIEASQGVDFAPIEKQIDELKNLNHRFEDGNVENGIYYLARAHGIMYKDGQFTTGVDWRGNGEISDGITY